MAEVLTDPSAKDAWHQHHESVQEVNGARTNFENISRLQPTGWLADHFSFIGREQRQALEPATQRLEDAKEAYATQIQDSAQHVDHFHGEAIIYEQERTGLWHTLKDELARIQDIFGGDEIAAPTLANFLSSWCFYGAETEKLEEDAKDRALFYLALSPVQPYDEVVKGVPSDKQLYWDSRYVKMLPPDFGNTLAEAIQRAEDEGWVHLLKVSRKYWESSYHPSKDTQDWSTYIALPRDLAERCRDLDEWHSTTRAKLNEKKSSGNNDPYDTDRAYLLTHHEVIYLVEAKELGKIEYAPFKADLGDSNMHAESQDELRDQVLSIALARAGLEGSVIQVNGRAVGINEFILGATDTE